MNPLFPEIRLHSDLPAIGQGFEVSVLELKASPPKLGSAFDYREMAKDVASFANAGGGVILVGACQANGVLSKFKALPEGEASSSKDAYEFAVRDRCSPAPLIDVLPIDLADGSGKIIAVHVTPFPGAPVGVNWDTGGGVPAYAFPLRIGSQTRWLRAEQLPMLTIPDLRRKIILLSAIPGPERSQVSLIGRKFGSGNHSYKRDMRLTQIDPLGGSITLEEGGNGGPVYALVLPIDAVDAVWKSRNRWLIAFRGQTESGEYRPDWE